MLGAPRARPLTRLLPHGYVPLLPLASTDAQQVSVPDLRRNDGDAIAGVPDYRGPDRLAPSEEPHWLDLLRRGAALPGSPPHLGLFPLHSGRKRCFALERV